MSLSNDHLLRPAGALGLLALVLPLVLLFGIGALALYLWGFGGLADLSQWATAGQRDAQNAIARALRALHGGDPGALSLLLGLCFSYGFLHAAGPGHGKILIAGYGMAQGVSALRLSILALLSGLAQSASAVLLVSAGLALLNLSRERLVGVTEAWLAPLSYAAIGMIGLWLGLRGLTHIRRALTRPTRQDEWHDQAQASGHDAEPDHDHALHHHSHETDSCGCGHRHGPTPQEATQARSLREAVILIAAIAARPCTGALFLLVLTWRMDILAAGIAGTFAMGLGVASVTIAVALLSVILRAGALERLLRHLPSGVAPAALLALAETAAGLLVAATALGLFLRAV
ncbi:nickel/cobalt transporter [Pseudooceanicola algae]|uniref:Nickel/cobalt efflux system n=1 Tax=Pseudooceanicola algae TaxID=1537215 RepID=A0A418SH39_9RHOB|nr:hypothetical protein [Pseudooceanicola algae]QPM90369.1 hypothetical protein PSAL_016070 [Pseudooceanicola algae]